MVGITPASADIVSLVPWSACQHLGLPANFSQVQGGVYCNADGSDISLKAVLSGTVQLLIADSSTPKWNIVNDTAATVTDLKLFYSGSLASNSFLDLQINGWGGANPAPLSQCKITEKNGTVTSGCSQNTGTPVSLPAMLEFFAGGGDSGILAGAHFQIDTASFAHAGQDQGCISGTSTCMPVRSPEPSALLLVGSGLAGFVLWKRRRLN
jgi:hypothetical protein